MTDVEKKECKRWGEPFEDKRVWSEYNAQLVKRGEFLLELGFVKRWDRELAEMNRGKVGQPYIFPESLIKFQGVLHAKKIDYRGIKGITIKLVEIAGLPAYNDYCTINRRVNKLAVKLEPPQGENLVLFNDGSGFQAIAGGEYLREKYGKKNRVWVQIIILGDKEHKEPVSFEVNIIHESEADSTKKQVEKLLGDDIKISAVGGDGSMDEMDLWDCLQQHKIWPIIKPDKNAREDSENELRNKVVKERNEKGYKKWVKKNGYGFRWVATEGIFSAIKRIFGEQLAAKTEIGLVQEAKIKIWAYQKIKRYGEARFLRQIFGKKPKNTEKSDKSQRIMQHSTYFCPFRCSGHASSTTAKTALTSLKITPCQIFIVL